MPTKIILSVFCTLLLTGCFDAAASEPPPAASEPVEAPSTLPVATTAPTPSEPAAATPVATPVVREFAMIARQWEFVPDVITVQQGETIRLTLTNEDVSHGISIPALGVDLVIAAGATETIEFVADKKGEFLFFCNVYCGTGHGDMIGTLIVE